jgi:hypothetical protein
MHPNTLKTLLENATVDVEVARDALGLGRNLAYNGVESGEIPSFRVGRRVMVPSAKLLLMLGIDPVAMLGPRNAPAAVPPPPPPPPLVKRAKPTRPARRQRAHRGEAQGKRRDDVSSAKQAEPGRVQQAKED